MDYIVTKSPKSKGITILLILIFGPIGLFYVSIRAGIIMTILPVIAGIIVINGMFSDNPTSVLVTIGFIPIFIIIYWVVCFFWGINALNDYNRELEKGSINYKNLETIKKDYYGTEESVVNTKLLEWSKKNPFKSINDFYSENYLGSPSVDDNRYCYGDDDKPDFVFIAYWAISLLIITSVILMYNTSDQSFKLSNILLIFD